MTADHQPVQALVTGGGGFLGRAIVERLLARGDAVRIFSRGAYPDLAAQGVDVVRGDLIDRAAVIAACRRCEIVYHLAGKPGIAVHLDAYYGPNVVGTENVLAGCREQGVQRLVFASSPSVIYNGQDMQGVNESVPYPSQFQAHYPYTKALAEQMVLAANSRHLRTISLRPHLIWGPGDTNLVPRIIARAHTLRRIGPTDKLVDNLYIDNAAEAHLLAGDALTPESPASGKAYFISQGEPRGMWSLINAILEAAGYPPVEKQISRPWAEAAACVSEVAYQLFRLRGEPRLTRFLVHQLSTSHWFDISAARRDLGYEPRVNIDEGLRRLRAWFKMHGRAVS